MKPVTNNIETKLTNAVHTFLLPFNKNFEELIHQTYKKNYYM